MSVVSVPVHERGPAFIVVSSRMLHRFVMVLRVLRRRFVSAVSQMLTMTSSSVAQCHSVSL